MTQLKYSIRLEKADDNAEITRLTSTVFGPSMFTRAAYALREGVEHEASLSFVAEAEGKIIGTVRLTKIIWGENPALMLGPLGVHQTCKNNGAGQALMKAAIEAAMHQAKEGGAMIVMLVGDYDYYARFGFKRIPVGKISLPRPADPQRILACELIDGALERYDGAAMRRGD